MKVVCSLEFCSVVDLENGGFIQVSSNDPQTSICEKKVDSSETTHNSK